MLQLINAKINFIALAWLAMAVPCFALPVITVGDHTLLPNQANQPVQIFVFGGEDVNVVTLFVQVADGGAFAGGSATGPTIQNVDVISGTIFANNGAVQYGGSDGPLFWEAFIQSSPTPTNVKADGLLATIFIDTTGIFSGTFALRTATTLADSDFYSENSYIPAINLNGTITVPEPATIVLGSIGLICLGVCARRRRLR